MKKTLLTAALLCTAASFAQQVNSTVVTGTVTDGKSNVLLGTGAGAVNTSSNSTFVGANAGLNNTTGGINVFVGLNSGSGNTTAVGNTFVGTNSGRSSTGANNVYFGAYSGEFETTSSENTFIGAYSGRNASGGDRNSFFGFAAGRYATGSMNLCIGQEAGNGALGSSNTLLGYRAGHVLTGSSNVFIGNNAGETLGSVNNSLIIANDATTNPLIGGHFTQKTLTFNAAKVGIGDPFGAFPATSGLNGVTYKLFVKGGVYAEEVRVRIQPWPDYVFGESYTLMPLKEVERFIANEGHLPNMPSAYEVEQDGLELGNIVKLQQEKIEELTLHLIEQDKQIEELKKQVQLLLNK